MKSPVLVHVVLGFGLVVFARAAGVADTPAVPEWALPGSATHRQVPPPAGFHRATRTEPRHLGLFDGQSDVGGALVPGRASYDAALGRYTIDSAGYNIWYARDEFHYLWKKISGDISLAADIRFPKPGGYDDRKVVLVIRQDLDDGAKEVMTALHGAGLIHLAYRPEKDTDIKEECRIKPAPNQPPAAKPVRIGLEKRGDRFALWVSLQGEPMHEVGTPVTLPFAPPFYVGIGFTSHLPVTVDTAEVTHVVLDGKAGAW
jgi:hypothetical protein